VKTPFWDSVVITASNSRQADRYREEIDTRLRDGAIPADTQYLVVPDPENRRIGSGAATIHALAILAKLRGELPQRILMIHSGGDSRRFPQFSPVGKLFGRLPGNPVFDSAMHQSAAWVQSMASGLLVMSGDVLLEFSAADADWNRPGVTGIGMLASAETGSQHGVYVADDLGRVYSFLQKPDLARMKAAGGVFPDGRVAVDTGLLRFDSELTAKLAALGVSRSLPVVDLYEHITKALTGQWKPAPGADLFLRRLAETLRGVSFHCSIVEGKFTHVGTTRHFRAVTGGGVLDSVLPEACELSPESVVMECHLDHPVRAGRGAILHGLSGIGAAVEVPDNIVVHQVPVLTVDGRHATVIRVYGVEDDPKITAADGPVVWLGRPMEEMLSILGIDAGQVWPFLEPAGRSLWDAQLFPAGSVERAWACARWMMGHHSDFDLQEWNRSERMSLASSSLLADGKMLAESRSRRMHGAWEKVALAQAKAGTDLRPMLGHIPGIATLVRTGKAIAQNAAALTADRPTEAASQYIHASSVLRRAGLENEAEMTEQLAFDCVADAVGRDIEIPSIRGQGDWRKAFVSVAAPVRMDLGGGWSDTPPFCQDWGGTVLNVAVELNGELPIRAAVKRLADPVFRCISQGTGDAVEFHSHAQVMAPAPSGTAVTIPQVALQLIGLPDTGGLEISTHVDLPLGSGLGTSSILSAAVLKALAEAKGVNLSEAALSALTMKLEQTMKTGGGWQDQAGGIFPGAKLLSTGPGMRQRVRVEPLAWSEDREAEFSRRLVVYNTGIQRMAKNLLRQVVRSYLARETATVQVLHSIKTLAWEMSYAMREGDWDYMGQLLDRHWQLNKVLDPNTANAPIDNLLAQARPYLSGAKLAGAGGGGFMMLLASSEENAGRLRDLLGAGVHQFKIAHSGLRVLRG
jgi:fucokinase